MKQPHLSRATSSHQAGHRQQPVHAIVPMKALAHAKSRLAASLSPAERYKLALTMFQSVLTILCAAQSHIQTIWVVSRDPLVLDIAAQASAEAVYDTTTDLNAALHLGRAAAITARATALLVVPADVPLLTTQDIAALVALLPQNGPATCVLAPNANQTGTNALGLTLPTPMPFLFGSDSFARHLHTARQLGLHLQVYHSPTLALDVDTPADLDILLLDKLWSEMGQQP